MKASLSKWKAKLWCATLESNADGGCHAHLMLQFHRLRDCTVKTFAFEELKPNARATDLLGDGFCKKKLQNSIDRGMFYVWANKLGTLRLPCGALAVAANYEPAWTEAKCKYQVFGVWVERLWKQYKLSDEQYEEYLYQTKDGLPARLRNLETYRAWKRKGEQEKKVEEQARERQFPDEFVEEEGF